ncbi:MAG: LLM class flavin-dependent oxidoreductase [Pseudomonadales bacterium]|jgi:alkanesulfonate monooxygenase SsuD/methylene tetrahydromethanopterin reductase-like flavin-dependent oxidoreductase (luciferase family)|nr:LLM class flavin-dependent oxidoreductase [Pseudomonadales bacterium]MDP6470959.1 LLM class flavin-dependent oxidoreductase [Pseudomonadales bacterium]MDP6825856.1 LLM class flavin-dependent oxidoreductase [Pseudomonadales bacterium]MDP6972824.1 LLM class flavin-dependent oxidoreductase [Pseudomonadales bacterium]
MTDRKPAMSLAAVPGRRSRTLEVAAEVEKRGFAGIYCPSMGDAMALCQGIASVTNEIPFGTSIQPIYTRHVNDFAQTAAFIHEISGGRFSFGIGVSHALAMDRLGVTQGKPLSDTRRFVEDLKAVPRVGELPPIVLATLRRKMIALAEEIGDGMVFANGARSHMQASLSALSDKARTNDSFHIGDMIPTCISDDEEAAKAVNRKTLTGYAFLPNYRNYWKEAGYEEEMNAVEKALADQDLDRVPECLSDCWLADTTLFGSASKVREGIEAWFDAGIKMPIIAPSSATGGQMQAIEEFFAIW